MISKKDIIHFKILGVLIAGLLGAQLVVNVQALQQAQVTQELAVDVAETMSPLFHMAKTAVCTFANGEQRSQLAEHGLTCGHSAVFPLADKKAEQGREAAATEGFNKGNTHETK